MSACDALYREALREHYGVEATACAEIQGGWSARAFRIEAPQGVFFLKAYDKRHDATPLWTDGIDHYAPIVHWLESETSLRGRVSAPIVTQAGRFRCEDERWVYMLYPFLTGITLGFGTLQAPEMRELGALLAMLHAEGARCPLPTGALCEDFSLPFAAPFVQRLREDGHAPIDRALAPYREELLCLAEALSTEAEHFRAKPLRRTLCHTDAHGGNLMRCKTAAGDERLVLVDWEGLRHAPPEIDIVFACGARHEASFLQGYRSVSPNAAPLPELLAFYRKRRVLEDIAASSRRLWYDEVTEEETAKELALLQSCCAHTEGEVLL